MARRLCENRELANRYDCQFHFIKVADPDGLKLNEGWIRSPFTPLNYALNYYSPPHAEQVEWGFPIRYKTLEFSNPPDETRAVMSVMNRYRPSFLYSLHNGIFCGVHFYLSRKSAPLFEALHRPVSQLGMTLDRGEPEAPWVKPWARAIYPFFGAREMYDYMEEAFGPNPPRVIGGGDDLGSLSGVRWCQIELQSRLSCRILPTRRYLMTAFQEHPGVRQSQRPSTMSLAR